jgi:hypothetical protein
MKSEKESETRSLFIFASNYFPRQKSDSISDSNICDYPYNDIVKNDVGYLLLQSYN